MSLEEHGKEKYLVCRIINRTQNILQISDLTSMEMKTNYSTQFYQRLFIPSSQILPLLYLFWRNPESTCDLWAGKNRISQVSLTHSQVLKIENKLDSQRRKYQHPLTYPTSNTFPMILKEDIFMARWALTGTGHKETFSFKNSSSVGGTITLALCQQGETMDVYRVP